MTSISSNIENFYSFGDLTSFKDSVTTDAASSSLRTNFQAQEADLKAGKAPSIGTIQSTIASQETESKVLSGQSNDASGTEAQRQKYLTLNGASSSRPPPYNFAKYIKQNQPLVMPIGANPFMLVENVQEVARWTIGMIETGKNAYGENMKMGDQFYFQSGTCDKVKSQPACQGQPRHIVVNNIPSHTAPCSSPTIASDPKSNQFPTGLLAGVIDDALHINPFEMIASSMGHGSIVNDVCVERVVEVGQMIPGGDDAIQPLEVNGVPQPLYHTVCAPKAAPLICSLESGGSSGCMQYVPSQVRQVIAYNNLIQGAILTPLVSTSVTIADVKQVSTAALNPNDGGWQLTVNNINNHIFATQVQKVYPSYHLPQSKNICLVNIVKCVNGALLYKWYANHKIIPNTPSITTYSFQVEWDVYKASVDTEAVVFGANIIGNSYHLWENEPTGYRVISEGFQDAPELSGLSTSTEKDFGNTSLIANVNRTLVLVVFILLILCLLFKVALAVAL